MTDPVYGDNPIDPGEIWDASFRPVLVQDPTWVHWRNVVVAASIEYLDSQWSVRWRRATTTATGKALDDRGLEVGLLRPAGWTDDRYRAVLVAILPGSFAVPTTEVAFNMATALLVPPQTVQFIEQYPNTATFEYTDATLDDAQSYLATLEYARPWGCQFALVYHPDVLTTAKVGISTVGGPDTVAGRLTTPLTVV
ncbi:MAG TPA: hypothetical protein VMX11_03585 [Actinomycetes bacterium]|nr:hypothetical protein [Actinomycetes bacterium]